MYLVTYCILWEAVRPPPNKIKASMVRTIDSSPMAAENAAVKVSVYPLKPNKAIAKRLNFLNHFFIFLFHPIGTYHINSGIRIIL